MSIETEGGTKLKCEGETENDIFSTLFSNESVMQPLVTNAT